VDKVASRQFEPGDVIRYRAEHVLGTVIQTLGNGVVMWETLAGRDRYVHDVTELELVMDPATVTTMVASLVADGASKSYDVTGEPYAAVVAAVGTPYPRPVFLDGGITMWARARVHGTNRAGRPLPNGVASAVAYLLGGEPELIVGTVIFTGTSATGDIASLKEDQAETIGDLIADCAGGVSS
jgi:hypothetical protein